MKTKTYYVLPPELSDGQSRAVTSSRKEVLAELENWLSEHPNGNGEKVTIEIVQLTDEEVKSLPDL